MPSPDYSTLVNKIIGVKDKIKPLSMNHRNFYAIGDGVEITLKVSSTVVPLMNIIVYAQGGQLASNFSLWISSRKNYQKAAELAQTSVNELISGVNDHILSKYMDLPYHIKFVDDDKIGLVYIKDQWVFLSGAIRLWGEPSVERYGSANSLNIRPVRTLVPEPQVQGLVINKLAETKPKKVESIKLTSSFIEKDITDEEAML